MEQSYKAHTEKDGDLMMDVFEGRINGNDQKPQGPSCEAVKKYYPPTDDIDFRED
jgi:hypothetical protein